MPPTSNQLRKSHPVPGSSNPRIGRNVKRFAYFVEMPHHGIDRLTQLETCFTEDSNDHTHEQMQSLWLLKGELMLRIGGEVIPMTPGSVAVLPSGLFHAVDKGGAHPNATLIDLRVGDVPGHYMMQRMEGFVVRVPLNRLIARAEQLKKACIAPRPDPAMVLAQVWQLVGLLSRKDNGRSPAVEHNGGRSEPVLPQPATARGTRTVAAAESVMLSHLDAPLSVEDLARISRCSAGHLTRLFQQQRGQSPAARFRELRIRRAEELLRNSCLTVSEIGQACGFRGTSQFARAFRTAKGIAPGAFRQAL